MLRRVVLFQAKSWSCREMVMLWSRLGVLYCAVLRCVVFLSVLRCVVLNCVEIWFALEVLGIVCGMGSVVCCVFCVG